MTAALDSRDHAPFGPLRDHLRELATERFERSADVATHFVHNHASLIARACLEMAERFQRGGRLLAFGRDAAATDARHVTVEFVHPVIVGKRALPAMALSQDGGVADAPFVRSLALLGRSEDIAFGISGHDGSELHRALGAAREARMLTLALIGNDASNRSAEFVFAVPSADALIVQEVHELLYHILWELVHVFLDHRGP